MSAISIISCRDYTNVLETIISIPARELPAICRAWEARLDDTYAVYAWGERGIVADADGVANPHDGAPPYDAATATGMYDRY